jgi:hypothetical protein
MDTQARFHERIWDLADEATEVCAAFEPPADPPDEERAMEYLREGAGPAVALFLEARTGGQMVRFPPDEYHALEGTMNAYLDLYCACYGVDVEGEFQLREAAELLVDTHNIKDVAQILTGVPERYTVGRKS